MRRLNEEGGFTLIELLLVVMLFGIIASMAGGSYLSALPNIRARSAAREVASWMQLARMQAVTKGHQYQIFFTVAYPQGSAGGSYEVKEFDPDINDWEPPEETISFSSSYPDVSLYSVSANPIFTPRGTLATPITVEVRHGNGVRYRITVSTAGSIKLARI